jgi:hypothetical protein
VLRTGPSAGDTERSGAGGRGGGGGGGGGPEELRSPGKKRRNRKGRGAAREAARDGFDRAAGGMSMVKENPASPASPGLVLQSEAAGAAVQSSPARVPPLVIEAVSAEPAFLVPLSAPKTPHARPVSLAPRPSPEKPASRALQSGGGAAPQLVTAATQTDACAHPAEGPGAPAAEPHDPLAAVSVDGKREVGAARESPAEAVASPSQGPPADAERGPWSGAAPALLSRCLAEWALLAREMRKAGRRPRFSALQFAVGRSRLSRLVPRRVPLHPPSPQPVGCQRASGPIAGRPRPRP